MDRREMMQSGLALTLAAASASAMAQAGKADAGHDHHHHDHGGAGKYGALVHAAAECGHIGQVCLAHCLVLLGQGDKVMAACATSVSELLATCDALLKLSTQNSKYVPKMAALALAVCEDCEKECRKHESKHKECKDCADACAACAGECKKVAA
jgi:Cys-rich four helix bundle protein (predicted Tat secretion target)